MRTITGWITKLRNALGWYEWHRVLEVDLNGKLRPLIIRATWYECHSEKDKLAQKPDLAYTIQPFWVRAKP